MTHDTDNGGPAASLIASTYYADPYYRSEAYKKKLRGAQEIELTRQALTRGEATKKTLAYARFLNAVENDATMDHGHFKPFRDSDDDVARDFPFLADLIAARKGGAA